MARLALDRVLPRRRHIQDARAQARPVGPLVTCVMLVRWPARAEMMRDALASFHAQTWGARELLVINEGEPLEACAPNVRVINTGTRHSLGHQRNLGLEHAVGEYVVTWDDDDASLPERLAVQVEAAEQGADYVICHRLWLTDELLNPVCLAGAVALVTALVRRSSALAAGGFDAVDFGEDASLRRAMLGTGSIERVLDTPLYLYRRHDTNVSTGATGEGLSSWRRFCVNQDGRDAVAARIAAIRAQAVPTMLRPRKRP